MAQVSDRVWVLLLAMTDASGQFAVTTFLEGATSTDGALPGHSSSHDHEARLSLRTLGR